MPTAMVTGERSISRGRRLSRDRHRPPRCTRSRSDSRHPTPARLTWRRFVAAMMRWWPWHIVGSKAAFTIAKRSSSNAAISSLIAGATIVTPAPARSNRRALRAAMRPPPTMRQDLDPQSRNRGSCCTDLLRVEQEGLSYNQKAYIDRLYYSFLFAFFWLHRSCILEVGGTPSAHSWDDRPTGAERKEI